MTKIPLVVLQTLTDRWNAHDEEAVYDLLDDHYREYLNGVLVKNGQSAARATDRIIYDAVPDYRREVDELYADHEGGAMRWRFIGTGPNGAFEVSLASTYRIRGGKITEAWIYGDPTVFTAVLAKV